MPQKRNPDPLEFLRGKTGNAFGNLFSMLTILKGLPLSYFKDMQDDKELVFKSFDQLKNSLLIFNEILKNFSANKKRMFELAKSGHTTATDLADYLVNKGLPFRDAHDVVGKAVAFGIKSNKDLSEFTLEELQEFNPGIEPDVFDAISLEGSINSRNHLGGTSPKQVLNAIKVGRNSIK